MGIERILIALFISVWCFSGTNSEIEFDWLDPDKKVYVLQNRKFRKNGRFGIGLKGGITTSGAFVDNFFVQIRPSFYFKEDFGFQLIYSKNFGDTNDRFENVLSTSQIEAFYRRVDQYIAGLISWSPFYSKINTFNQVFYIDWILGAGIASVTDEHNGERVSNTGNLDSISENSLGIAWDFQAKLYLTKNSSLTFGYTGIHYQSDLWGRSGVEKSQFFHNYDLGLGLNLMF